MERCVHFGSWSLPFNVQTDSLYDPSAPIPRPLAREQTYRTYPISQESFEGRRRISSVELREPRIVGLLTEIRNAKVSLLLALEKRRC